QVTACRTICAYPSACPRKTNVSSRRWPGFCKVNESVVTTTSAGPLISRLAVVGLGLIGGSFAKGLRQSGLCREVVGCDRDPATLRQAVPLGVVDRVTDDLAEAVQGADLIMLAV